MIDDILAPLEQLRSHRLPHALDGSQGIGREISKPCLINARTDIEAIECWLKEYGSSQATQRTYRKDTERLVLWAIIERHKPLSSLMGDDLTAYSQFLENPQPAGRWCGPKLARKGKRWTTGWRPFVAPLSLQAKVASLRNITSLFNYLTEVCYLASNPILPVRRQIKQHSAFEYQERKLAERMLGQEEWQKIQVALNTLPSVSQEEQWKKVRLRFLVALLFFAGLRNHEVVIHTMGAFYKVHDNQVGKDRWWLQILGKSNKWGKVPVNQSLLDALIAYRRFLKLPDLPQPFETEPLMKSKETNKPLTTRRINQLLKRLMLNVAEEFESSQPEKAARLKKFSAHWLRHLHCSMQSQLNLPLQHIKENARHQNAQTTELYVHAFDHERHEALEKLSWQCA
jgi:integrase